MCALRNKVSQFVSMSAMQLHGYERLVMIGDGATDLEVRVFPFSLFPFFPFSLFPFFFHPMGEKHDPDFLSPVLLTFGSHAIMPECHNAIMPECHNAIMP